MSRGRSALLAAALLALVAAPTAPQAGEWSLSGPVGAELRIFPEEPAFPGQRDTTLSPSVFAEPELRYEWNDGADRLTFVPFGRLDADDDNRTHADVREANWLHVGDGWDLVIGIDRVFWGVTESRHLVDIINQTDGVENIDGEEKLGQPMANLNFLTNYGTLRAYVLPGFRERTFPDDDARLRGPLPIEGDDAEYESAAEQGHVDFALRYANSFGPFDLGLAHFHGTSREPRLFLQPRPNGSLVFVPFYDQIDQTSIDLQATFGGWLLKLEAMTRTGQGERINAVVGGFEYTIFDLFGGDASLGLLAEYLYDDRGLDISSGLIIGAAYDDDVFAGLRLQLNDVADTYLLAGVSVDRDDASTTVSLEASRRLDDRWRLELEGWGFFNVSPDDVLAAVADDDHLILRLVRFF
jgi:hypothetical protein